MRTRQTTERKLIPLEYLEEETLSSKRKQQVKPINLPKGRKTKNPRAFPKFKVASEVIIPRTTFVNEVPKSGLLPTPSLSFTKTSIGDSSKTWFSLTLRVPSSISYFSSPTVIRLHVVLPVATISPKKYDTAYPRVRSSSIHAGQFEVKTRIPRREIATPIVQVLKLERIQEESLGISLLSLNKVISFPRSYIRNISTSRTLLVPTKISSVRENKVYPKIAGEKLEIGILLPSTSLPLNSQLVSHGSATGTPLGHERVGSGRVILPKAKPIGGVIGILGFKSGFAVIGSMESVDEFIKMEAEKMERENLLSELLNIRGYLPKGASEALDKPIFVLLGQDVGDWHYPIAYLLSEIYKEIKGEKPNPTLRDFREYTEDAKNVDSSKEVHLMVTFKPWGKIEILDGRGVETSKIKSFFEKIRGRLETAYLQGLGFFLIVAENSKIPKIEDFLSRINGISKNIILPEVPGSKILDRYNALTFALLGLEADDFLKAIEKYEEALKKTVKTLSFFVPRGTDEAQEHSFKESHQYPLKVAVFSYLLDMELKKLDERPTGDGFYRFIADLLSSGKIKIESPIRVGDREVIPDIIYNGDDTKAYIEIETLVGTEDPLKKIDMTIGKYILNNQLVLDGHELWIVLRPVSALIHYEDLKHYQKLFRILYGEVPIKFKVLVYDEGWKLIRIETFARWIKEALRETRELREKL